MATAPLRTLMLDDDPLCRKELLELLETYCPEVHVVASFDSAVEAHQYLLREQVDLVFLDVEMPEMDGFGFLELLPQRNFAVIFVTGHNGYAIPAFRVAAVDYLLKPLEVKHLRQAITRVLQGQDQPAPSPTTPPQAPARSEGQRITLPTAHGFMVANTGDIMLLEADNTYVAVHLTGGKKILVKKSMKDFERMLDEAMFVRVHKSFIVHLKAMEEYSHLDGGTVRLIGGRQIPIARRKLPEFHEKVKAYSMSSLDISL